jgi:hypothetical protein
VSAAGPLRGPGTKEAAAPPLAFLRPLRVRGRHPGLKGAAHRATRDGLRPPLTPGTPAAPGSRKSGRPQPAPAGHGRTKASPPWP